MLVRYPRRIVAMAIAVGGASSPAAFTPPLALVPRPPAPSYRISRCTGATPLSWSSTRFDDFSGARCEHPPTRCAARRVLAKANRCDGVELSHDACGRDRDGVVEGDGECSTKIMEVETTTTSSAAERRGRWRRSWSSRLSSVAGRFDTLTSSGLSTPSDSRSPGALVAGTGSKRMMVIFFSFLLLKWARSKFLLKNSALNEFQPNWGHVITSKEQEKNLHAWTCKECGATMFVAKGREFRFHNRFTKCFNCGAKGKDNFYDRRDEIEDDGDFQYESPVNYRMSKKEREKLEREMEEARQKEAEEAEEAVEAVDPGAEVVEDEEEEMVAVSEDDGGGEAMEVLDAEEVEVKEKDSGDETGEGDGATAAAAVTDEAAEDGEPGAVVTTESEEIEVALEEGGAEGSAPKSTGEEILTASAEVEGAASDEAATEGADAAGEVADVDESRTFIVGASGHTEAEVEGAGVGVVENDAARDASSSSVSSSSSSSDGTPAAAASTPSPVPEVPATKSSAASTTTTTTTGKTVPSSSLKQSQVAAKKEMGGEDSLDALGMDGF